MHCMKLHFEETGVFSNLFLDYLRQDSFLKSFISFPPTIESIDPIITNRNFDIGKREILRNVLLEQYSNIKLTASTRSNIESLKNESNFLIPNLCKLVILKLTYICTV